jgi:alkanesulfonate monooxygenase SsuD/methylene tetrahydromethanopterin reductase-like flavin-dependent oxidoreductase (luciferase family)
MLIGLELTGHFGVTPGWTLDRLRSVTATADATGVDFVLVQDCIAGLDGSSGWPDATILLGWLAASTQQIGLIAAVSTGGHQPYNLSRRIASLDRISHGRIGWCLRRDVEATEAAAFSGPRRLPRGNPPERIGEFVQVVEALWHGWDEDALLIDKETGRFIDPEKMHRLDHQGPYFSVRGPLNVMRSPQDRPVLAVEAPELEILGSISDRVDLVLFEGAAPAPAQAKRLRRVTAAALAADPARATENADGIVIEVASPHEAEQVLQTELMTRTRPPHRATTLRARLQGSSR